MKCKVCGYEFDSNREYCPMCGSKIPEETRRKAEEEMSWNTYDFPKPKKLEEIEMHWPSMNAGAASSVSAMKSDATEGFVQSAFPARQESAGEEAPKKKVEPMPDPWAALQKDFPKTAYPDQEAPQSAPVPDPPMFQSAPAPAQQPRVTPQPAPQSAPAAPSYTPPQPAFPQGAWQMPQMQPEPTWTPYNVQQPQPQVQVPPISPMYAPTSFTQQYGSQYSQPQTAWTIPPQPQPGQVYVTQPAQPVYIQPQPPVTPVYVPAFTQPPAPAPASAPAAEPAPEPVKAAAKEPEPAPAPAPAAEPAAEPAPAPQPEKEFVPEPGEKVLEENIVASMDKPAEEPVKAPARVPAEEKPAEAPKEEALPDLTDLQSIPEPEEDGRYPERFFTFNKKNEEFQQLLNREYERLRSLHGDDEDLSRTAIYRKNTFQPTPAQDFFHSNEVSNDLSEFEKMLMESTQEAEGDETLAINRDRIKGAALSAEDLIDPLPVKSGGTHPIAAEPEEKPAEPEPVQTPEEAAKSEHRKKMEAMARAREAYFASLRTMTAEQKAIKDADFKAQLEKEARIGTPAVREKPVEKTPEQIAAEKAEEARLAAEKEAAERAAAIERAKAEMKAAQEAHDRELGIEPAQEPAEEPAEEPEAPEKTLPAEETQAEEPAKEAEEEKPAPVRRKTEAFDELLDDVEEEKQRKEERERSHWFLKFLLALILVIAAAEGGTIALRHYAPDSPASIITTGIEQNVIQFVESSVDQIKAKFQKEEPQQEQQPEDGQSEEEGPAFVLSDIIAASNKNIGSVTENLGIGYDSQRTYDVPGLSASELVTDTAEKTEVCKTLISYNSSWIDFVNGVNQDCLDYMKADGAAYRSAVTFDKVGQITEKFLKLEIGEIRRTADAYFVFAGEAIEVTEGENTTRSAGTILYELVRVGEELKIKNYYTISQ